MDLPTSQWGFFEWGVSIATTIMTGIVAHIHTRLTRAEIANRQIENDLHDAMVKVYREATDGREQLRKEIQENLSRIYARLDQTPTKSDLQDWVGILTRHRLDGE